MSSFYQLCENIKRDLWFPPTEELEEDSLEVIQRGLEIRSDRSDGNTFWDDFISVIGNNTEATSKLLGVSPDRLARALQKIKSGLKKVRESNDQTDSAKKKKNQMLPTGY